MSALNLDWRRIEKTLADTKLDYQDALKILPEILTLCGEFSQTRKMAVRIGKIFIQTKPVEIIAPACPDYSHCNGKYTFEALNNGVSLLALKHIEFLKKVLHFLPKTKITILMADQEAYDPELCRVTGKNREEFRELVMQSIKATQEVVTEFGWTVKPITEAIPEITTQENEFITMLQSNPKFLYRLQMETISRIDMYRKIRRDFTREEMLSRTIRTAAQYLAFGHHAAKNNALVCNHTTANLSWYLQTEAAVLHNSISIY